MEIGPKIKEFLYSIKKPEADWKIRSVSGGSINQCFVLVNQKEKFFLKVNDVDTFPSMFEKEAAALQLLKEKSRFKIPVPLLIEEYNEYQFLLMEWVESKPFDASSIEEAGRMLAFLHLNTAEYFGLEYDNFIGSLTQINCFEESGTEFYREFRFRKLIQLARDTGRLSAHDAKELEKVLQKLDSILPSEKPALLHGDLWSGNIYNSAHGPCIFDPAIYYGFREADIAMTLLFGGFSDAFYNAYNEVFPLENNWRHRMDLHQLYPNLVHLILFGHSYYNSVMKVVEKYS